MAGGSNIGAEAEAWSVTGTEPPPPAPPAGYLGQTGAFSRVLIDKLVSGGSVISWYLTSGFGKATPYSFVVQWARAGSDDWTVVTTVIDTYVATDSSRRDYSALMEGFYRVVLTTADGSGYTSQPSNLPSNLTLRDLRIIEDLRRRELLVADPDRNGVKYWLLARRNWGTVCTSCTESVSREVVNARCGSCYGTGFVGGYHAPHPMHGLILARKQKIDEGGPAGTAVQKIMQLRVTPLLEVSKKDVVILDGLDERYFVESVTDLVSIKGKAVVQQLTLIAAPPSDIIYSMQWGGTNDPTQGEVSWI